MRNKPPIIFYSLQYRSIPSETNNTPNFQKILCIILTPQFFIRLRSGPKIQLPDFLKRRMIIFISRGENGEFRISTYPMMLFKTISWCLISKNYIFYVKLTNTIYSTAFFLEIHPLSPYNRYTQLNNQMQSVFIWRNADQNSRA